MVWEVWLVSALTLISNGSGTLAAWEGIVRDDGPISMVASYGGDSAPPVIIPGKSAVLGDAMLIAENAVTPKSRNFDRQWIERESNDWRMKCDDDVTPTETTSQEVYEALGNENNRTLLTTDVLTTKDDVGVLTFRANGDYNGSSRPKVTVAGMDSSLGTPGLLNINPPKDAFESMNLLAAGKNMNIKGPVIPDADLKKLKTVFPNTNGIIESLPNVREIVNAAHVPNSPVPNVMESLRNAAPAMSANLQALPTKVLGNVNPAAALETAVRVGQVAAMQTAMMAFLGAKQTSKENSRAEYTRQTQPPLVNFKLHKLDGDTANFSTAPLLRETDTQVRILQQELAELQKKLTKSNSEGSGPGDALIEWPLKKLPHAEPSTKENKTAMLMRSLKEVVGFSHYVINNGHHFREGGARCTCASESQIRANYPKSFRNVPGASDAFGRLNRKHGEDKQTGPQAPR